MMMLVLMMMVVMVMMRRPLLVTTVGDKLASLLVLRLHLRQVENSIGINNHRASR